MTEKRFIGSSGGVYDQYKGDRFTWAEWEDILQIMNNLNEKARERSKALSKLQKENEQLKEENKKLQGEYDRQLWLFNGLGCEYDSLKEENEQLKKGMVGVVDRYIRNVDCNPPSSAHTYIKIKGALMNIREDLRDLIEDLE